MQTQVDLGALITSGHGKDAKLTAQFFLLLLATAVLPIGIGYFLATQFGTRLVFVSYGLGLNILVRSVFYYIYICAGVVFAVVLAFVQLLAREKRIKTEILIYENGIAGVGLKAGMGPRVLSNTALQPFCLPYSQISQASIWQSATTPGVWIDAQGSAFCIYPPNVAEILEVINKTTA